jgi:hypothetical protein
MDFDSQDQEIIRLLGRLKEADGKYPEHMLAAQRQNYLQRMAEIEFGGSEIQGKNGSESTSTTPTGTGVSLATSTLLETALVAAILVEASAVAYFYREKLADFFGIGTGTSRVQVLTPTVEVPTSLEIQGVTPSPVVTTLLEVQNVSPSPTTPSTFPSTTISANLSGITVTLTSTPIPGVSESNNNSTTGTAQLNSTPIPNGNNGNNGNHYGQTPKPERTKDKPPKDNNDPSPPENNDKPPKEEPKPTKSK